MLIKRKLLIVAVVMLQSVGLATADQRTGEYTFTVLRDGDPIGHHRFAFACRGNRIEIREETEIEVSLAMIPIFSFEHAGRQIWEDGRAVRIDATTNDNGDKVDITVRSNGDGYIRTVNGRVDKFDDSMTVLAFWNKDTLRHNAFFSAVEDKTFAASFTFIGKETVAVAGTQLETEHYRMIGDEQRDLWFDHADRIAKVAFRRHGADVVYVRDQVNAGGCDLTAG